jgi:hypothetical protein
MMESVASMVTPARDRYLPRLSRVFPCAIDGTPIAIAWQVGSLIAEASIIARCEPPQHGSWPMEDDLEEIRQRLCALRGRAAQLRECLCDLVGPLKGLMAELAESESAIEEEAGRDSD